MKIKVKPGGSAIICLPKEILNMSTSRLMLLNVIAFQLLWWLCVLSPAHGWEVLVLFVTLLYTWAHLRWVESSQQLWPLLLTAVVGCLLDQYLFRMDWVKFPHQQDMLAYIPLWMMALWLGFATTLNLSMHWLQHRLLLATLLGAIFGPIAYLGAEKMGAVVLTQLPTSLVLVAVEWAIALPLLLYIRRRFNQQMGSRR